MPLKHANLVAWQRADDLFLAIHHVGRQFPALERFELSSQLRRAAYSVVANIVEGVNRRSPRETQHFLHISAASLAEVHYCLHAAHRLGDVSADEHLQFEKRLRQVGAPLAGLIRSRSGDPNG